MPNSLSVCVLGSSSKGNATLVWTSRQALLIDCGLDATYLTESLEALGFQFADLSGILITHLHTDHARKQSLWRFIDKDVPVYVPDQLKSMLQESVKSSKRPSAHSMVIGLTGSELHLGDCRVRPFEVPHDSDGGCFGYTLSCVLDGKSKKLSISTDIARMTDPLVEHLADSDIIVLESNYDEQMLDSSGRPEWLKRRIREQGHLSNTECAESLLKTIERSQRLPKTVALAHISEQCNTKDLARTCTEMALANHGIRDVHVVCTHPRTRSRTMTV